MSQKMRFIYLLLTILILSPKLILSDTSCKITGNVVDADTKEPLVGANIVLEGTSIGAATDISGMYSIVDIPAGSYTLKVSYLGYHTQRTKIHLEDGEHLEENFKLTAVGVVGKTVTVTAQASGQNAAINQQLSSNKIVNVVSSARIQELPDANAAESVGRLPGISLVRSGGEATGVVIRGLSPKYNEILIDGVEMAGTNSSDRSVDLSMISSNSLNSIEVYKTVTPDMDAAVLGGIVNFGIRKAKRSPTGTPRFSFLAQGGYNDIVNYYGNYKFVGTAEDRYMNGRFGVFVQAIIQKQNYSNDQLGGSYDITNAQHLTGLHDIYMTNLNLNFFPREKERYDGTLTLDYKLPGGKVALMNFFSRGITTEYNYEQNYGLGANTITFTDSYSHSILNTVTNLLDYSQNLASTNLDVKLSSSFSDNNSPNDYSFSFITYGSGVGTIDNNLSPKEIADQSASKINPAKLLMNNFNTSNNYSKQQNFTGSIDLKRTFRIANFIEATLKAGGQYKYTYRSHNEESAGSSLQGTPQQHVLADIINALPWLTEKYNIPTSGIIIPSIIPFIVSDFNYGNFLNGDYKMGPGTNIDVLKQAINAAADTASKNNYQFYAGYRPSNLNLIANDYHGHEDRTAAYFMATINMGSLLTIIPGVRYQGLLTSYYAPRIYNPNFPYNYPIPYPHQDTTINEYHGYWLPDVSLIYKPYSWLSAKLAYTNTLSYPDFTQITPLIKIASSGSITWHNFALKPARSQNYDANFSIYNNSIGLFTAGGFLKQIDGLIFGTGTRHPRNFTAFPGIPQSLPGGIVYSINYSINDPYRTNVWGIEAEWRTHFWYLPHPLEGLVLNVNYTHLFSSAKYPFTYNYQTGYPPKVTYVDTFYSDRLYQQPNNIANFSLGYDYEGFSIIVSMIYQSNIFNSNNFWPELRGIKEKYLRWDISAKQNLPWYSLQMFMDINNLNNENDSYIIEGPGYNSSIQDYGMTADLGIRLHF